MSNMATAIKLHLAATNGGPGLTDEELAARLGCHLAVMRTELAGLVFTKDGGVTCIADSRYGTSRYKLGDSTALRKLER